MSVTKIIIDKYGQPDLAYQNKYCMVWEIAKDFPWAVNILSTGTGKGLTKIYINQDFKTKLHIAFINIERAGLQGEIKTFDGCYNQRSVRGRDSVSLHAWAMAVDLNASSEKLAQTETNWSGQFIAIMKAAGIFWGGDWHSRKDSMHFALYNG